MTTTAALLTEARKLSPSSCACAASGPCWWHSERTVEMRRLLPQLADALEDQIDRTRVAQSELQAGLAAAEARLAKVRERAMYHNVSNGSESCSEWQAVCRGCNLCRSTWTHDGPERHAPDCPARPMEPGT